MYRYDLGEAMKDGFVKEPAVATRANFDPSSVSAEWLERIKLEDGVHHHDHVTVELDRYHRVSGRPKVHPFMLVVAQDTTHARALKQFIESDEFFAGRFRDKVIEVHSAQTGQENEEAMARLVALQSDTRTEIVIHVNKLKEGWDVTNFYTIVPLRASASDILTEQTHPSFINDEAVLRPVRFEAKRTGLPSGVLPRFTMSWGSVSTAVFEVLVRFFAVLGAVVDDAEAGFPPRRQNRSNFSTGQRDASGLRASFVGICTTRVADGSRHAHEPRPCSRRRMQGRKQRRWLRRSRLRTPRPHGALVVPEHEGERKASLVCQRAAELPPSVAEVGGAFYPVHLA
jgi:hypothetical protein